MRECRCLQAACLIFALGLLQATTSSHVLASSRLYPSAKVPVIGNNAVVNTNNQTLYVATCEDRLCGVVPYQIKTGRVLPLVPVFGGQLFFNPFSNSLFASDQESIWIMDGDTYDVELFSYLESPGFALDTIGHRMYIVGSSMTHDPHGEPVPVVGVGMYQADTLEELDTLGFEHRVFSAVAIDEVKSRLYVGLVSSYSFFSNQVAVLDATTLDLITTITNVPTGVVPHLDINPTTNRLYVSRHSTSTYDNITVIDTASDTVVATVPIPCPDDVVVAERTGKVYVTTCHRDAVYIINRDDELEAVVQVGDGTGNDVKAINPLNGNVYVSHWGSDYRGIATIDPVRPVVSNEIDLGIGFNAIVVYRRLIFAIAPYEISYILTDPRPFLARHEWP